MNEDKCEKDFVDVRTCIGGRGVRICRSVRRCDDARGDEATEAVDSRANIRLEDTRVHLVKCVAKRFEIVSE